MKKVFSYSQNCIIAEISDSVMKKVTITIRNEALDAVFRCTNQEAPVRLKWFFEQIIIYRFNYYKSYVQLVTIFHFKKFPCTFLWVILHKEIFTTLEFVWARFFKAQSLTFFCWKFTSLSFSLLKVFPNWIQILPFWGENLSSFKTPWGPTTYNYDLPNITILWSPSWSSFVWYIGTLWFPLVRFNMKENISKSLISNLQ